jgi:protoporphyrinogen/coproporphyrinogen III oxidase
MVVVVGAGVSGLALATFLRAAPDAPEVLVLEAGSHPGGNVRSDREGERILDRAANGWLSGEPAMERLLDLLDLRADLVPASPAAKERFVWAHGRLHPVPLGPVALARSDLLTFGEKLRMLREPFVPRGDPSEESVADFARRRLGPAAVDRLVGPMVAGVFAGDPEALSLAAAFPRMVELERDHGSLFRAMVKLGGGGAPRGHLTTLRGGAGQLGERMAERLGERVRVGSAVTAIEPTPRGWRIETATGPVDADVVALATPGHVQAPLVRRHAPAAADALEAIPYAPIAVVMTAFAEGSFRTPPQGFGVLRARGEPLATLGTLFTSRFFPHEAPPGEVFLRSMLGGATDRVDSDDDVLRKRVLEDLDRMFGLLAEPTLVRIVRHARGIPQYTRGHLARVSTIRAAERPDFFFTGSHLEGVGVKDCVRAGAAVAARIGAALERR